MTYDFRRPHPAARLWPALILLIGASGCISKLPAHVTGRVTLDGEPLVTGTVTFYDEYQNPIGVGLLSSAGHYEVMSNGDLGLPPGDYRVTVEARLAPANINTDDIPKQLLVPKRYGRPDTSNLRFVVVEDREHPQRIDLALIRDEPASINPPESPPAPAAPPKAPAGSNRPPAEKRGSLAP